MESRKVRAWDGRSAGFLSEGTYYGLRTQLESHESLQLKGLEEFSLKHPRARRTDRPGSARHE